MKIYDLDMLFAVISAFLVAHVKCKRLILNVQTLQVNFFLRKQYNMFDTVSLASCTKLCNADLHCKAAIFINGKCIVHYEAGCLCPTEMKVLPHDKKSHYLLREVASSHSVSHSHQICHQYNSHLVTVNHEEELYAVGDYVSKSGLKCRWLWTAATRIGTWKWKISDVQQVPITYFKWDIREPSDVSYENSIVISISEGYGMHDTHHLRPDVGNLCFLCQCSSKIKMRPVK